MTNWCALVLLELGLAAFDEKNSVIVSNRFTNPAQSFRSIKSGRIPTELEELKEAISNFDDISVNDSNVNELLRAAGLKTHLTKLIKTLTLLGLGCVSGMVYTSPNWII